MRIRLTLVFFLISFHGMARAETWTPFSELVEDSDFIAQYQEISREGKIYGSRLVQVYWERHGFERSSALNAWKPWSPEDYDPQRDTLITRFVFWGRGQHLYTISEDKGVICYPGSTAEPGTPMEIRCSSIEFHEILLDVSDLLRLGKPLAGHLKLNNFNQSQAAALTADATAGPDPLARLRIMTFNIRYENPHDGVNIWANRKDFVADVVRFQRPDLIGFQEAVKNQLDDLAERLPEYAWVGVGRDDGLAAGEYSPIFYRKERFHYSGGSTFWLSEDPSKPGKNGWDASCQRIVTWGHFNDRVTGRTFFAFNTHFDNAGETARAESAKLLLERVHVIGGIAPIFVTGDFNCTADSVPYNILTSSTTTVNQINVKGLVDSSKVSIHGHFGPTGSLSGFEVKDPPAHRIDFIFIKNGVSVFQTGILDDSREGRYPSDHLPVIADVSFAP